MRQLPSQDARLKFRDLLDEVTADPAAAIQITRWDKPVAVIVSAGWFERATAALSHWPEGNTL